MKGGIWRLLVHGAADGATNMAVDEAILDGYVGATPLPFPTLRLYAWSPPALSLGRRQSVGAHDPAFLAAERIDLVRRPTGGAAVLHENERTYSLSGRLRAEAFPGGVLDTYRRIAEALVAGLLSLGIPARAIERSGGRDAAALAPRLCFAEASAHEIAVGSQKVVGSAQLRRRGAFLQHGSILSRADPLRAARAAGLRSAGGAFAGIEDVLRKDVGEAEIDAALMRGFEAAFGIELCPGTLSACEEARAASLCRLKYRSAPWTIAARSSL